ncbi:RNA 2',3'-cyclic phosphodiesterase [Bartonella sp. CB189]|uniref:RNA 2',3'-cyclic phosphodiesterase n=1 Tax=Bartonella sp. CB189 TaxID=3112254 RepID=UPI002F962D97
MLRLFSAVQIPKETTESLISLQNGLTKAQWINPENFHITLSFFGEVDSSVENELICAFNTIELPPFELRTNGFKVFSQEDNTPHSLVVRINSCETLDLLHKQMQCIRNRLKLPPDVRQFSPHITIARLLDIKSEDLSSYLSAREDFSIAPFWIHHFVLLLSPSPMSDDPYIVKGSWKLQA